MIEGASVTVKDFGAVGDGVTDDTAAIQAALDYSSTSLGLEEIVEVPNGIYMVHELNITNANKKSLVAVSRESKFVYNGTGASGSYILKLEDKSFGTIRGVTMTGDASLNPPESLLVQDSGDALDMMFSLQDIQFGVCWGDAIVVSPTSTINTLIKHVRFDSVGGYCIRTGGSAGTERRPVTIRDFTVDNNATTALVDKYRLVDGKSYGNDRNGEGVIKVVDGNGLHVKIENSRVEFNLPLATDTPCFVYDDNDLTGQCKYTLQNVTGFFSSSYSNKNAPLVQSLQGRAAVTAISTSVMSNTLVRNISTGEDIATGYAPAVATYNNNAQQDTGLQIGKVGVVSNHATGWGTNFDTYKPGTINLYRDWAYASRSPMYVAFNPTSNSKIGGNNSNFVWDTASAMSSGSAIVTATATTSIPGEGVGLVIAGAGVAGADLETYVTAVDLPNSQYTVNDAASTTVASTTVTTQNLIWKDISQVIANQRFDGTVISSDSAFYDSKDGDLTVSRNFANNWRPDAFVCRYAGDSTSSGNWRTLGSNSGTTTQRTSNCQPFLTGNDAGFTFFDSTLTALVYWDGSAWRYCKDDTTI